MKKLYKSDKDQVFSGVLGGLGEYFQVDSTLLRLAFIVIVLLTGIFPGLLAYIIAVFIVPEKPHSVSTIVTPPPMNTGETTNTTPKENVVETKSEEVKTETKEGGQNEAETPKI